MPIRLPTENCGRARLCGMGRARPFRVHHSRPWSRGDAGRRATWGFPRHFSDQRSVLSQFSLRSAAISHPELELFYGRCPGGHNSRGADFQRLGFLVAASVADLLQISVTTRPPPAATLVWPNQVSIIFCHANFSPQFLWLMPQARAR